VILEDLRQPGRAALAATLAAGASLAALLSAPAALAAPPPAPAAASKPATVSELVVTGEHREPGEAVGDIKPDLQLEPEDVAAYGVSTITDLLDELGPEIGGNSGRGGEGPAILINGRRISGFNEIRNLPTEAILRVDILPEEAALKYGFSANQRVVNIVLRDHYGSELVELAGGAATAGGAASGQAEAGLTRISGQHRLNLDVKYDPHASLTEAERGVTPLTSGPALDLTGAPVDDRRFRTLVAEGQKVSANAVLTRPIFADISATVNATFEATSSKSLRGLPSVRLATPAGDEVDRLATGFGALGQESANWTGHLGVSLNRDLAKWRLALTGNYDHADSSDENDGGLDASALQAAVLAGAVTLTPTGAIPAELLVQRARDTGHSKSDTGNLQFIASGPTLTLPAGQVRASFRLGATGSGFSSRSERFGFGQSLDVSRSTANAQANFDLPITSRRANVLPWLGDITLNGNVAVDHASDFGTLTTVGYGVHWTPFTGLSILASHLRDQAAPTQQQLGAPLLLTPGTRIFDYVTGQTVDVTQVSGGNPDLRADKRDRFSLRATWQPFVSRQLIFRADYNEIHVRDPIATFPAATADIEAAFPERFMRDADGGLTQVDYRPVNFARQDISSLKWGFNYSRPIGPVTTPPPRGGALGQVRRALPSGAAPDGPPPGRFADRGGGGMVRGGRGATQDGRLRISVFHTVYFDNNDLVRPGGPLLDFLNGASMGGLGGQPRQEIQAQINVAERGYGAELAADWKSGTSVRGGGGAAGDLDFSGVVKVNARLFADLSQRKTLVEKLPWLRGSRLTVSVSNIFDQRIEVRDAAGITPLSFQPAYIDPLGRTWRIGFRKLFS
jgi:hypothetical protein